MKNIVSKLTIITLLVLTAVACKQPVEIIPEPIWDGATTVVCVDIAQLHSKSGLSNMSSSELEQLLDEQYPDDKEMTALLRMLMTNPSTSGISSDKPMYVAVGEYSDNVNNYTTVASIDIASVEAVDAMFKSNKDNFEGYEFEVVGQKRIITIAEKNTIIGYDNQRLVAIASDDEQCNLKDVLLRHMTYAAADMSRFSCYDIGLYIDIHKVQTEVSDVVNEESEAEDDTNAYMKYLNDNATAVYGLTFDNGSLTLNVDLEDLNEEVTKLFKASNGRSLKMLPPSPIAILNMGVNGEAFAELADIAIDAAMEASGGATNEFNIYKNIALGVVGSISGDFMMALSDANGTISEDALGDKQLLFTTAKALFTAEVVDDYIMKNIKTYAGSFLSKSGDKYTMNAFGNQITIAQRDNIFRVGVNNDGSLRKPSAADEEWSNNVVGSYAFAMVDFDQFFKSGFGRIARSAMLEKIVLQTERKAVTSLLDTVDRLYITIAGDEDKVHGEFMVVTSDASKNSLQYIFELYNSLLF